MPDSALDTIFKAYDVRGIYPDEIDEVDRPARRQRLRRVHRRRHGCSSAATPGRRRSRWSPPSSRARSWPAPTSSTSALASTDLCYFAAGSLDAPAAMFTASHNPAQYNGIKLCRAGARPIGEDTGLGRDQGDGRRRARSSGPKTRVGSSAATCCPRSSPTCTRSSTSTRSRRCGSSPTPPTAWAGSIVPAVFAGLPFELTMLYGELDGTFPNHPADPIQPENLKDLAARGARRRRRRRPRVRRRRRPRRPRRRPGAAGVGLHHHRDPRGGDPRPAPRARQVVHNLICSKAVPEVDPRARRHADPHAGSATRSSSR